MSKYSIEKVNPHSLSPTYYNPRVFNLADARPNLGHCAIHQEDCTRSPTPAAHALTNAQFDERKGPTWHCIVGRNFGSFVTHETKHFIYFYLGHCAILLFKTQ